MIGNLIEYGKWLSKNNLDDFGKNTKNEDYILLVNYSNNEFGFSGFNLKENFNFKKYFQASIFRKDLLIITDQKIMIPSNSNLRGLSPFFLELSHKFLKNGELNCDEVDKFRGKVEKSLNANKNGNEFISFLSEIYSDVGSFLDNCPLNEEKYEIFLSFFSNNSFDEVSSIIIGYYDFIFKNVDLIIEKINDLKSSDDYNKKTKPNFYLACCFNNELDLLNDLFVYYSKIFKKRKEKIEDFEEGICSFCGRNTLTYSSLGSYTLTKEGSFNFSDKMENSKLRTCKLCNSYLRIAEDNLKSSLSGPMMIIPKSKGKTDYSSFFKISNLDKSSFSKINEFLKDNSNNFNYDLIFYEENRVKSYIIHKYVENYQAYLIDFNKNIKLYDDGLTYLFNENYFDDIGEDKKFINNIFDLEDIFRFLFIKFDGEQIKYPNLDNFYNIYTKDLIGEKGILYGFDTKTISIFAKYMYSIFSFIYELNEDALNRFMINEMFLNALIKIQRNISNKKYVFLKYLNYYFMIIKEFLGENMLKEDNVNILKKIFSKYHEGDDFNKISDEDENQIFETIRKDVSLKYYLLGQFISLIDNTKGVNGKNSEVFSNFVLNANKNNIKKLFTNEVLQKNNFYIGGMNKKGKFIFKVLENNLNSLFDEEDFYFEDYLLLIFIGYYTENILSSSYGAKN